MDDRDEVLPPAMTERSEDADELKLSDPERCTCEWRTTDGGRLFHSFRAKADPRCRVHRGQ